MPVEKVDYAALWKEIARVAAGPVEDLAQSVASKVDVGSVTEATVGVKMSKTRKGQPVALVGILHPAGLAMQAKHGTLTRAAAAAGLEVKSSE